jgi:hypothetical protein
MNGIIKIFKYNQFILLFGSLVGMICKQIKTQLNNNYLLILSLISIMEVSWKFPRARSI